MQSESDHPAASPLPAAWTPWTINRLSGFACGFLPVVGLFAELLTGCLSQALSMFPTWWHVGLVLAAVLGNCALHLGAFRSPRQLVLRAAVTGFALGMGVLYAVIEAPAALVIAVLSVVGLGLLAAAPFFVCLGMFRLVPDLERCWRAEGRPMWRLAALLFVLSIAPTAWTVGHVWSQSLERHELAQLADAMRDPRREDEAERLAASLRDGEVGLHRAACAFGISGRRRGAFALDFDDEMVFARVERRRSAFPHLANSRPFWFTALFVPEALDAQDARLAFHRAHGVGWNDGDEEIAQFGWRGGRDNEWLSSRIEVRPEPDAALAQVDWHLEVTSRGLPMAEARFDLRLPPLAVASSLSSWIDGQERPAAFAGSAAVQRAYDAVVARQRDPALLQEQAPGSLRLLLFPLARNLPPMRVRLGFTVPLRWQAERAELWLPQLVAHTCLHARVASHELVVHDGANVARRQVDDEELGRPLLFARGALAAQTQDADGVVVQRLVPRAAAPSSGTFVVVLEASTTVGEVLARPADVLAVFPPEAEVTLFVAHGASWQKARGLAGSPDLARFVGDQSFAGGVDARAALQAACDEAVQRGAKRVHWLHGAAAEMQQRVWPEVQAGVQIAALPLHRGRNVVREGMRGDGAVVELPRFGAADQWRASLQEALRYTDGATDFGDHARVFERRANALPEVATVGDQLARLWASRTARELSKTTPDAAAKLAARYRVVTAGVGAVVLETASQYQAAGLDPGALIGREPAGPVGSLPVPEPSTWLLVASGIAALCWRRRKAARAPGGGPAAIAARSPSS
ncbi:MAG: PEP-CTERM sorting domain-containing protein [Planctomycetes bacterium]|nr:PEP-CTERM sorting domain-containing protein [Planctomycetota bacterium]